MNRATIMLVVSLLAGTISSHVGAQDWPQWRGANRDAKAEGFNAPETWPKGTDTEMEVHCWRRCRHACFGGWKAVCFCPARGQ